MMEPDSTCDAFSQFVVIARLVGDHSGRFLETKPARSVHPRTQVMFQLLQKCYSVTVVVYLDQLVGAARTPKSYKLTKKDQNQSKTDKNCKKIKKSTKKDEVPLRE